MEIKVKIFSKWIIMLLFFPGSFLVRAQSDSLLLFTEYKLHGISMLGFQDSYLSQLPYSGLGYKYEEISERPFSLSDRNISIWQRENLNMGLALNPSYNAIAYLGSVQYAFGINRNAMLLEELPVFAGLFADMQVGMKYMPRNVNNPFSLDASVNLNLRVGTSHQFQLWKRDFQFHWEMETPLTGLMFLPDYNQTYYELSESTNWSKNFVFSSFHNKRGLAGKIMLDIPLKNAVLSLGLSEREMFWKGNGLTFYSSEFTFMGGLSFDLAYFSGSPSHIPPRSSQIRYR